MGCGDTVLNLFSEREKIVLKEIEEDIANRIVKKISRKYNMPKSTIWYILKKFRKIGIIDYEEGSKIVLSKFAKEIKKHIKLNGFKKPCNLLHNF